MSKLTTPKRNAMADKLFGEPAQRKYPMPDASHAVNAKSRTTQAVNAGRMPPSTAAKIDAKANRVIKGKKP